MYKYLNEEGVKEMEARLCSVVPTERPEGVGTN